MKKELGSKTIRNPFSMPWLKELKKVLSVKALLEADSIQSSVLALIATDPKTAESAILLMKRTVHVETHKGQVCFPGGYRESSDETLLHTALRETEEEIGLPAKRVQILGRLETVRTRGNVEIAPWVGQFDLPFKYKLNAQEVEKLLFLPIDRLLQEGLKSTKVQLENFQIISPGIVVEEELVWGATAKMLVELREYLITASKAPAR